MWYIGDPRGTNALCCFFLLLNIAIESNACLQLKLITFQWSKGGEISLAIIRHKSRLTFAEFFSFSKAILSVYLFNFLFLSHRCFSSTFIYTTEYFFPDFLIGECWKVLVIRPTLNSMGKSLYCSYSFTTFLENGSLYFSPSLSLSLTLLSRRLSETEWLHQWKKCFTILSFPVVPTERKTTPLKRLWQIKGEGHLRNVRMCHGRFQR